MSETQTFRFGVDQLTNGGCKNNKVKTVGFFSSKKRDAATGPCLYPCMNLKYDAPKFDDEEEDQVEGEEPVAEDESAADQADADAPADDDNDDVSAASDDTTVEEEEEKKRDAE